MPKKTWFGSTPTKCDLCKDLILSIFIDGATKFGPWAIMCPYCHQSHGRGLGTGLGQKYEKQGTQWVKVEG